MVVRLETVFTTGFAFSKMYDSSEAYFERVAGNFQRLAGLTAEIGEAAEMMTAAIREGGKVIFCGNGGSAADAQHLAAELMGRYLKLRDPMPALALTVDTSALTAIANDYGYDDVFSRQLKGIGQERDVLVGLSTSGNSKNVLRAFETARTIGVKTIALTGEGGGAMAEACDVIIRAPSAQTNHIQEMHIAIGHYLCGYVEDAVC